MLYNSSLRCIQLLQWRPCSHLHLHIHLHISLLNLVGALSCSSFLLSLVPIASLNSSMLRVFHSRAASSFLSLLLSHINATIKSNTSNKTGIFCDSLGPLLMLLWRLEAQEFLRLPRTSSLCSSASSITICGGVRVTTKIKVFALYWGS